MMLLVEKRILNIILYKQTKLNYTCKMYELPYKVNTKLDKILNLQRKCKRYQTGTHFALSTYQIVEQTQIENQKGVSFANLVSAHP